MRVEGTDVYLELMRYHEYRLGGEEGESDSNAIKVLMTGFGPFREHVVNASWQAVRLIPNKGIALPDNIPPETPVNLILYEVPVIYDTVAKIIPQLWEKHQPHLVVHVGVSGIAKALTVEQTAHNYGYSSTDIMNCIPEGNVCIADGCDVMESGFEMREVVNRVNCSGIALNAEISYDPGRYLCDFIYYHSLNVNKDRTAFIHVPPLGKPWSAEEMADGISICITEMLHQLQEGKALGIVPSRNSDTGKFQENRL